MSIIVTDPETLQDPTQQFNPPAWFQQKQSEAQVQYDDLTAPTRRVENWRFGNLKALDFSGYSNAPFSETEDFDMQITGLKEASGQFIFANDSLVHAESDLPEGVICLPLQDALEQHSDLVERYFMQNESKLGSAKYAALHAANTVSGLFVYVPKGVEVQHPIESYQIVSGDKCTIYPHTIVVAEEQAKVSVIEYFKSADEGQSLTIAVNELYAHKASQLSYISVQDLNLSSKMIMLSHSDADQDAQTRNLTLNVGGSWVRNEAFTHLKGKGSHADMLSLNIPSGTQEYDQRTYQHHGAAHTYSDLLYKNTLYGKAKTIFSGLIFVDEGAHYTDAYQTCRNLLMEDTTEANSMPGLQINADQVKCSHGSTSAAISDEEIFYLKARGIQPQKARQLIASGFSIEVLDRLKDEAIETLLLGYIEAKYASL